MNSLRITDRMRVSKALPLEPGREGHVHGHTGLQQAARVYDAQLDPEDEVLAVPLRLDVARREFGDRVDRRNRGRERLPRKGIGGDGRGLPDGDAAEVALEDVYG